MIPGLTHQFDLAGLLFRGSFVAALIVCTALAMIVHEFGHLAAAKACKVPASEIGLGVGPKLFGFRISGISFSMRALPLASFLRLDGSELEGRPLSQRLFVHLGGIMFNMLIGCVLYGTLFGRINLLLAAANVLPLYKHDGWKCGVAVMRTCLRKRSRPAEWTFTFSGGLVSMVIISLLLQVFR